MNAENEATALETIDPGCLPAWDTGDMPEPKPFLLRNLMAWLGPGLVLAGGSIGTGEWVMGPLAAAKYQGAMMWAALVSIVAQVIFNTEVMRYTLVTGEPIMTAFMRCKPGPRFWLAFYLVLDVGSWLPALAGLAAQILVVWVQGLTPTDAINPDTVRMFSYGVFLICASMALFGGKIYHALQYILGSKFLFVLGYLAICALFFVSFRTWTNVWGGLINPMRVPLGADGKPDIDWSLISSLAGFAGIGGLGNIMASNFVREKGWGMGGKVGAIPSAFGGHELELSHLGVMCPDTDVNRQRFREWFKYIIADQYVVWALGSLIAMMLPCMLGAEYLHKESLKDGAEQWRWAAAMAQDFGAEKGAIFRYLTLFCGLIIMIPGQFYLIDTVARRWTDAIWSGSRRIRKIDTRNIKKLYYSFAGAYVLVCCLVLAIMQKLSASDMMKIAGNLANLAIAATIIQTLYVNRRFLPKGMRPSRGKEALMVISALFFFIMFGLVVNQKVLPVLFKMLGKG